MASTEGPDERRGNSAPAYPFRASPLGLNGTGNVVLGRFIDALIETPAIGFQSLVERRLLGLAVNDLDAEMHRVFGFGFQALLLVEQDRAEGYPIPADLAPGVATQLQDTAAQRRAAKAALKAHYRHFKKLLGSVEYAKAVGLPVGESTREARDRQAKLFETLKEKLREFAPEIDWPHNTEVDDSAVAPKGWIQSASTADGHERARRKQP